MIDDNMGYTLPNITYLPYEHALDVCFLETEYVRQSMLVKLGKRQEAAVRYYIERMEEEGRVVGK